MLETFELLHMIDTILKSFQLDYVTELKFHERIDDGISQKLALNTLTSNNSHSTSKEIELDFWNTKAKR